MRESARATAYLCVFIGLAQGLKIGWPADHDVAWFVGQDRRK